LKAFTAEAAATGFRPEMLKKVIHLLGLLEGFMRHPCLKSRIALKGGTAMNLFVFDVPRLSVDIDMDYVGAADRETMLAERPKVDKAIAAVCGRQGFSLQRVPDDHAGGKWRLRYDSALGQGGNVEVDLNFLFRVPLWPVSTLDSRPIGSRSASDVSIIDRHELAAVRPSCVCKAILDGFTDIADLRLQFLRPSGGSRINAVRVSPDLLQLTIHLLNKACPI
jgi:hypothetical protein